MLCWKTNWCFLHQSMLSLLQGSLLVSKAGPAGALFLVHTTLIPCVHREWPRWPACHRPALFTLPWPQSHVAPSQGPSPFPPSGPLRAIPRQEARPSHTFVHLQVCTFVLSGPGAVFSGLCKPSKAFAALPLVLLVQPQGMRMRVGSERLQPPHPASPSLPDLPQGSPNDLAQL